MFEIIRNLLLLLFIFLAAVFLWRYMLQRADEKLRNNPPERRVIEVSLPSNTINSAQEMTRFYRKVASGTITDEKGRKKGLGQLDFVYLGTVLSEGGTPFVRSLIYTDPDKMDAVKKALKSSFASSISVVELQEDPLAAVARQLRPATDTAAEVEGGLPPDIAGHLPPGLTPEQQEAVMQQIQDGVEEIEIPGELSEETARALNIEPVEKEEIASLPDDFTDAEEIIAQEASLLDEEESNVGDNEGRPSF
jgi:hypothetical protein